MEVLLIKLAEMRVDDLLADYLAGSAYRRLAASTRREYARVAAHLQLDIGATTIDQVGRPLIRRLRDRWGADGHRAASLRLQLLKNATQPLIDDEVLPINLFDRLSRVAGPGRAAEPHPVWKPAELETVIRAAGHMPGLVRAVGLARYGGFRRDDLCRMPVDARIPDRDGVRYRWTSGKGQTAVEHREDPRLTVLLDRDTPARAKTIAYNMRNGVWQPRQLSQALARVLARLARQGEVRRGLTWHGLRHTRGVELAESGCSDAIIMAQLGHTTDRSAQIYRRQASRRRLGDVGQALVDAHRAGEARPESHVLVHRGE